ncbi:MAG: T9SS type A sorting domain-containing protein [Saprospiraceae bacterium]|nr:T9SS type A sorting domain-containing protein [Saprospiraceae bacterium]
MTSLPCPDNALAQDGPWLVATEGGNQYTWIDCSNDQILEVSDVPLYKPEQNGSYRVAVMGDYCKVESACISFALNNNSETDNKMLIYPTIFKDNIYFISSVTPLKAYMVGVNGITYSIRTLQKGDNYFEIDVPELDSGIYYLQIITNSGSTTKTMVKI